MMKKVPKRRFKGFLNAGDWEQRKLGDVADVKDGTHDSPKFYNDGFPLVTSKNLKDGSIDFSDCSFISEQDFNEINKRSKVDRGDILFGMIGTIGNPAIVEHNGFAIKNVALIKEGKIINNRFIYHLLSSKVFENYIARENAGGTQKFIALNQIRSFNFLAPALVEQNKIIELLDYISQSITLHQRKLEKLQATKKALLYELFPIENNRRPKRRFKGFTGDWEQRKLGDLADGVFGGGTPNTSIDTYWNGNVPWIQSSNLMDDKIENFINDKSITNLAIKESTTKLIPANSIAIVTRVGVGKVALIREKFATSQDFLSFHCRHEHNPLFMAYQISRLMKVKSRLLQGTSIKGITKSEVLESEVLIPKGIEEENKIADFLSSCDNLITLHQRKLEKLKNLKAAYLNEMFV